MSNSGNSAVSTPPNDAQVKVFKPPSGNAAPPPPPADNGLKPTSAELKSAFQDHIQQRHGPDAPMMTKAMREKEEAKRRVGRKVYSEVKIRVRFADRTQLETSLPVTEKLPSIYGFVRNSLNTAAQQTPFTLFTSPPKTDYKESDKRTLRELGFVPAAVLSVRWENAAFNNPSTPAPLRTDLASAATDLPPPKDFDVATSGPSSEPSKPDSKAAKGGSRPTPKWLKGIIKK